MQFGHMVADFFFYSGALRSGGGWHPAESCVKEWEVVNRVCT